MNKHLTMLYSYRQKQLLNGRVCYDALKSATIKGKNMPPIGSIFFPLKVSPMRIKNNFRV